MAALEDTIAKQKAEIDELRRKLEHMNEVFANAQRVRFGQSSEKNSYVLHDQASFFNEAEKEQAPKAEEPTPDTILVPQHERKKKRSQAEVLNGLPEEEVLLKLPEYQLVYGKCGGKMKPIGKKFLRHEMQIIPKQIKLLAYYAVTYLADLNEQAQKRLDTIMEQMKAADGVTEELKRTHQMEWVQRCNNIHNRAEEIILQEMIYS